MSINSQVIYRIRDELIKKRREQTQASGYQTTMNSNHMCAILDQSGVPISYGTNVFNIKTPTTEHAEAQALRKLMERLGRTTKKIKIDILVIRTNGHNSKPCDRCIRRMEELQARFSIRHVYFTHEDETDGLRCVKFCKLIDDPERHYSSYDRNVRRLNYLQACHRENKENKFGEKNICKVC
jgi:cytidine deaminase